MEIYSNKKQALLEEIEQKIKEYNDQVENSSDNKLKKIKLATEMDNNSRSQAIHIELNKGNNVDTMMESSRRKTMVESTIKAHRKRKIEELSQETYSEGEESEKEVNSIKKKVINSRKVYSPKEKEMIIECYMQHGEAYTIIKHGIPEETLKNFITKYNNLGNEAFQNKRN